MNLTKHQQEIINDLKKGSVVATVEDGLGKDIKSKSNASDSLDELSKIQSEERIERKGQSPVVTIDLSDL